jgi:hypothetical protein
MDFTPATYTRLIEALQASGYSFQTIADFCHAPNDKSILLRHDVELLPQNALAMAKLEHVRDRGTLFNNSITSGNLTEGNEVKRDELLRHG